MKSKQVFPQEKQWKPSGTKANARYRGVTDLNQYSNFILESAHDLNLLSHILTGNEKTNIPGHEKAITDNYISLFNGDVNPVAYNSFTASNLMRVNKNHPIPVPPMERWESVGGCVAIKTPDGCHLTSPGTFSSSGIRTALFVQSGEIVSIRLRAKSSQDLPDFSIGSQNINGFGDVKKFPIQSDTYGFYIDYRLYCKNHETIFINIYLHDKPSNSVVASSVDLYDIGLYYGEELPVSMTPLNGELKTNLNKMRETLNFLKN